MTLDGATLASTSASARAIANASVTANGNLSLGDATNTGALNFSGSLALGAANRTLTLASDVSVAGVVSGAGLTKAGSGKLTLGGVAHTFNGDLTVSAGTLALNSGATLAAPRIVLGNGTTLQASGGYSLGSGKTLQIGASGVASANLTGNLTLSGGSLAVDIGGSDGVKDLLAVTGDVNLGSGKVVFNAAGGSYVTGSYAFLSYTGSLTGTVTSASLGGLTVEGLSASGNSRIQFTYGTETLASVNYLKLNISGTTATLDWTGGASSVWSAGPAGPSNWSATPGAPTGYTGGGDKFHDLDAVNFGDASNRAVTVDADIVVGAIGFANSLDYAFTGANKITGTAAITKSGAGAVDLGVGYEGTGGISVSQGTLRATSAGFKPGAGASLSVSGTGRIELGSSVAMGAVPIAVSGSGALQVLGTDALGSGAITLDGGSLELGAAGSYSNSLTLGASGGSIAASGAGTTTLSSGANLAGNLTLSASSGALLSVSGALSGAGALTKTGEGTVALGSAATYAGATTVSAGTLRATSTLGASGSYAGAIGLTGNLELTASSNQTLSGAISGAGSLAKSGGGILTISNNNTDFSGAVSVSGSTLSLGHVGAAGTGAITLDAGTLSHGSGNVIVANNLVVGAGGGTLAGRQDVVNYTEFSGTLAGSASLTIDGLVHLSGSAAGFSGKYVINDADSYFRLGSAATSASNLVEFTAGNLRVDGSNAGTTYTVKGLASTQAGAVFAVADAGGNVTLDISPASGTSTYGGSFSRNGTPNFVLRKSGAGTQVLNRTSGAGDTLASVVVAGGVLELASTGLSFNAGYFGASQSFSVEGGTLLVSKDWNLAGGNSVAVSGGGTLNITADSGYLNNVTLSGGSTFSGKVRMGYVSGNSTYAATGSGTNTISANLVMVEQSGTTRTLTLRAADADTVLAATGSISDLSSYAGTEIVKTGSGKVILSGAVNHGGGTTVSSGTLQIGAGGTTGSLAGDVVNNAALVFNRSDAVSFAGLISGTGSLTQAGSGTLTVSNTSNSYSGNTSVTNGTLVLGALGALRGTITVSGGYLDLNDLNPSNAIVLAGGQLLRAGNWSPASVTVAGEVTAQVLNDLPNAAVNLGTGASVNLASVTKNLVITGAPSLTGLGSYAGSLSVNSGGTLDLSGGAPAGTVTLAAGGTVNFGSAASSKTILYSGGTVTGSNYTGNVEVVGSVNLGSGIQAGTVRVTAGNSAAIQSTFTGDITFAGGTLTGLSPDYSGTVTLETGALYSVGVTTGATFELASGSTLKGDGTVGALTQLAGSVLAPGNSPGLLTVAGDYTLSPGATFEVEIADPLGLRGTGYDAIDVGQNLNFSALQNTDASTRFTLKLIKAGAFELAAGTEFQLISYGFPFEPVGYTGNISEYFTIDTSQFLNAQGSPIDPTWFQLSDSSGMLRVTYTPVPEPSTYGLILGGLALAGAAVRRRRKAAK